MDFAGVHESAIWHIADLPQCPPSGRYRGQSGEHMLNVRLSDFDPWTGRALQAGCDVMEVIGLAREFESDEIAAILAWSQGDPGALYYRES
jgi:hypothetical protein